MHRYDEDATRDLARSLLYEALYGASPERATRPLGQGQPEGHRWQAASILAAVLGFYRREGRLPTYWEWGHARRYDLPARDTVLRHWGSKAQLVQAARTHLQNRGAHHV